VKLIVTIDTEADPWKPSWHSEQPVTNIAALSEVQELFTAHDIRPTYLVDFPVASSASSVSLLRSFLENGQCEIGAHCHPWTTPPFEEPCTQKHTMLCNLPRSLILRKLRSLHHRIIEAFDTVPTSFRAGRWGYSTAVAVCLDKLGYKIDTSITPLMDWTSLGGPNFSRALPRPYCFNPDNIFNNALPGRMIEVPATIGLIRRDLPLMPQWHWRTSQAYSWGFPSIRLLTKLRLLRKVWLSPEVCSSKEMIALTKALIQEGAPVINLFFHSPTLQPGLTPFTRIQKDKDRFLADLREFLRFARSAGCESITLSEATRVVPRHDNKLAYRNSRLLDQL